MIRAVLDVNVLASALVSPSSTPAVVLDAAFRRRFLLVTSETMLDRLNETITKSYFQGRRSDARLRASAEVIRRRAELVEPASDVRGVADDLEDDLVLATAVAGNASHLVAGDRGLLGRDGYRGLTLLTPAAFRLVLAQPETPARR